MALGTGGAELVAKAGLWHSPSTVLMQCSSKSCLPPVLFWHMPG